MPRASKFALGAACALLLTSCLSLKAHVMARAVTNGLYSIESYRARVTESGLLRRAPGVPVVKSILYERPWKVRAEVVSPEEHAGELFVYDGATISVWWPRTRVGLRIRGLETPGRREVAGAMLQGSSWILGHYDLLGEGHGRIAARDVDHWRCVPLDDQHFVQPYQAWMDAEKSIPLKLSIEDAPAREWYGMEFESIEFGAAIPPGAFQFGFPAEATVFDCDLSGPAITVPEAQGIVDFPVLQPDQLPAGHFLRKVVMGGDPEAAPIVVLLMSNGARWLSLSETQNAGPATVPEVGIQVPVGNGEGLLNFAFGFTLVSWSVDNTALTLIGNLPYPEMLAIAATVGSTPPRKAK
ncbi:MAG: hypothetical protein K8T20_04660 [Planctomycetes bacterium]|nr:hypothetical protein [Planctomycetota bacterium]